MMPPDFIRRLIYKLPENYRPILPIFGGVLLMLTFGTMYTQGNMNPYILSYMRQHGEPNITIKRMTWLTAFQGGFPFSMLAGGFLNKWIGPRPTATIGAFFIWTGTALTDFSVQSTFPFLLLTDGILFGLGSMTAYSSVLVCAMRWLPRRPGLASGLLVAGFGLGSSIFSPVQTAYINPNNYSPNCGGYFCQHDLLSRVTTVFLLLAICYVIVDAIGLVFICNPRKEKDKSDNEVTPLFRVDEYENSVGPIEAMKSGTFWSLSFGYLCNVTLVFVAATYWKTFGQTFIRDDFFLTAVTSFSSVCNCVGRIFWGSLADRFSFQIAMGIATCLQSILAFTLVFTSQMHKIFFLLWICAVYFTFASNFSLYPMATANCFGPKHVGLNYGMIFAFNQLANFALSLVSELFFEYLSYLGIFVASGILSLIAFGLTVTIQLTKYGKGATLSRGASSARRCSSSRSNEKNGGFYDVSLSSNR